MHVIGIRRTLAERYPFLPSTLAKAFEASKKVALDALGDTSAAKVTLPWLNLYSAAKSAMCSLTDGLRMELRADGIHVIAVCPGYVRTDFQKHVLGSARAPQRIANTRAFLITAEQCAEAIVRGVERGSRTVVTPRVGWAFVVFARLFPRVLDWYLPQMQMQRGIS